MNSIHLLTQPVVTSNGEPPNAIGANTAVMINNSLRTISATHTTSVEASNTNAVRNIAASPRIPPVSVFGSTTLLPNADQSPVPTSCVITPVLRLSTAVSSVAVMLSVTIIPNIATTTPLKPRPNPPKSWRTAQTTTCSNSISTTTASPIVAVTATVLSHCAPAKVTSVAFVSTCVQNHVTALPAKSAKSCATAPNALDAASPARLPAAPARVPARCAGHVRGSVRQLTYPTRHTSKLADSVATVMQCRGHQDLSRKAPSDGLAVSGSRKRPTNIVDPQQRIYRGQAFADELRPLRVRRYGDPRCACVTPRRASPVHALALGTGLAFLPTAPGLNDSA